MDLPPQTPLHDLEQASQALLLPQPLSPPVLESANPLDVVYLSDLEALLLVLEDLHLLLAAFLVSLLVVSQERRHQDSLAAERLPEDLVSFPGTEICLEVSRLLTFNQLVSPLPQDLRPRADLVSD